MSVPTLLQQALLHHHAGRWREAEALYQEILLAQPDHPDALHLLGMVAHQAGRHDTAADLIGRAILVKPAEAMYHNNLGMALGSQGRLDAAAESFRRALLHKPAYARAHYNLGGVLQAQGEFAAAIESYRKALSLQPDYAEARHYLELLLRAQNRADATPEPSRTGRADANEIAGSHFNRGNALMASGRADAALASYDSAIALAPDYADAHVNRGAALLQLMRAEEALASFERVARAQPDHAGAHNNCGIALYNLKRTDAALASYDRAIRLKPDYAEAHNNRANALLECGRTDAALASYERAIAIKPDYAEAHNNRGIALRKLARADEALASYDRAIALAPNYADAHVNRGATLLELGRPDAALASLDRAISLCPGSATAHNNRGQALEKRYQFDAALASYERAIAHRPGYADAHSNLGNILLSQGRLDEAIEYHRKALGLEPDNAGAHGNLLFALNYHPDMGAEEIYRAYQEYNRQQCAPLRSAHRAHGNDKSPQRRLRVGYVSPDFCDHSCRYFLEPLLAHHDKGQVEVFAYAELDREDKMTARYKTYADRWVATRGMSDEGLAERIRNDGIDILVDLAGHTAGNRLLSLAHKPAPVSVSWLGYGYTTGLSAIDYYLTDAASAPQGSEALFAERPWRVATPAYVFRPKPGMGEAGNLPALQRGHVTFGTLTRSVRINHRTVRAWSEILKAVPGARLVIDSANFKDAAMRERMAAHFAQHGVERERLTVGYHTPPWDTLRGTDIGLDCFPHNSGTTLFETLYMGVPVITLAERPSVGRLGSSILHGVGHPEWIAENEDDYVAKAVELAGDITRLSEIRAALRGQMQAGPLMDEAGFARKVEDAYRGMWQAWCNSGAGA
jgi:protein O-GlcNAc transferase